MPNIDLRYSYLSKVNEGNLPQIFDKISGATTFSNKYTRRGIQIHDLIEGYYDVFKKFPPDIQKFFDDLKLEKEPVIEKRFYKDLFTDGDFTIRLTGQPDCQIGNFLFDWKSVDMNEDKVSLDKKLSQYINTKQLDTYALADDIINAGVFILVSLDSNGIIKFRDYKPKKITEKAKESNFKDLYKKAELLYSYIKDNNLYSKL